MSSSIIIITTSLVRTCQGNQYLEKYSEECLVKSIIVWGAYDKAPGKITSSHCQLYQNRIIFVCFLHLCLFYLSIISVTTKSCNMRSVGHPPVTFHICGQRMANNLQFTQQHWISFLIKGLFNKLTHTGHYSSIDRIFKEFLQIITELWSRGLFKHLSFYISGN